MPFNARPFPRSSVRPRALPFTHKGVDSWVYFEMSEEDKRIVERIRRALASALARRVGEIRKDGGEGRRAGSSAAPSAAAVAAAEERLLSAVCAAMEEDERENFVRAYTRREGFGGRGRDSVPEQDRGGGGFRYKDTRGGRGRGRGKRF